MLPNSFIVCECEQVPGTDALSRLTTLLTVRRDGLPVDSNATQTGNQPEATRYHFDLLGRPDYTELPNGVVEDYLFDNMDRLDLMQHFKSDSNNADLTDNALKNMFDYSYRADGKRVGLVERFDTSGSGIRPGSSTLTNSYTWTYDNAGRLVSEVLDSSDNTLDQTELNELRYSGLFATGNPTGSPTQTTTYTWNATQQSSKTVLNSFSLTPQVSSLFSYARQFITHLRKPNFISGLSPAISISQKSTSSNAYNIFD